MSLTLVIDLLPMAPHLPRETWSHRTVGMSGVELITLHDGAYDREYLFSLIDGALNSDQQLDQLAVDVHEVVERLNWFRDAAPLLAELARHINEAHSSELEIVLPTVAQTALLQELRRLADLVVPPFDVRKPVYTVTARNDLDMDSDTSCGFPTMCLDAGAVVVRPAATEGFYDAHRCQWSLTLQLRDGVTFEAWLIELARLWRDRIGDVEMWVKALRADAQIKLAELSVYRG